MHGDVLRSFTFANQPVSTMIAQRLPVSAQLGFQALIIGVVVGTFFGVVAARFKNTWVDGLLSIISTVFFSVPSFIVGTLLLLYFGYTWELLPVSGWGTKLC
ncbi:hypothetical protein N568_0112430 [Lactococcus garvieae TRF1]|uniref:ABC transmembrane type-1 domain-containing protein n=1 Tax=Lactococcus garvieae TRF1 TaxID=1380772 RepID=V8AL19_9LACT|nr:hypothetical protein N568_0112430 [Lactococcus garvieae TRF1]